MNLRHAAALALVGWYLMTPPYTIFKGKVPFPDADAPLREWKVEAPFDRAKDCEERLTERVLRMENAIPASHWEKLAGRDLSLYSFAESMQCIASDDPRLKEK